MPRLWISVLAILGLSIGLGIGSQIGQHLDPQMGEHTPQYLAAASIFHPFFPARAFAANRPPGISLHTVRQSQADLEVAGELAGLSPGQTRYIPWDELHSLPQTSANVTDDSNFTGPTKIEGVPLDVLAQSLGAAPESDLVIAICDDLYRAAYPRDYIAAHHPMLVLQVNDQPPDAWPKDSEGHGNDMGPYMISHPSFTPSFKILSHSEEAQIPWGVVRIEFRDQKTVFGAIAPVGAHAEDAAIQAGFHIAQQNCFRCHNMGAEGGKKSGVPWVALSQIAAASPELFARYVRNPAAVYPKAQMPGNPTYDDATVNAITSYFQTFSAPKTP